LFPAAFTYDIAGLEALVLELIFIKLSRAYLANISQNVGQRRPKG
jgi:hypothetical protein